MEKPKSVSHPSIDRELEIVKVESIEQIREDILSFEDRQLFQDLAENNRQILINDHLHGLSKSATLEINERSAILERDGKKIYRFGLGQSPFPVPESVVQALRDNAHEKAYLPVKGLIELRKAVAEYHRRKNGIDASYQEVMIGPGSKELLFLVQLTFDGDLIVPSPCWVSYIPQAVIIGRRIRLLHTDHSTRWRVTPNLLRNLCEEDRLNKYDHARLLLLNYPGNPDGNTYTVTELKKLAKVAKKYNILILSDEIYGELNYKGEHVSIAQFYPEGTIVSAGLSKWAGAGGWRLGTFTFPKKLKWLMDAMAVVASETYTSVCSPIQYAAITAYKGSHAIDLYLDYTRKILKFVGEWCSDQLNQAGIIVITPVGGFYIFLDFENYSDKLIENGMLCNKDLTDRLLDDTGVAILPGVDFARPMEEFSARLAFVNFDGEQAIKVVQEQYTDKDLDEDFLDDVCPDVKNGIHMIIKWVESI